MSKNEAVRQMLTLREARRIDTRPGAKSMLLGKENPWERAFVIHATTMSREEALRRWPQSADKLFETLLSNPGVWGEN